VATDLRQRPTAVPADLRRGIRTPGRAARPPLGHSDLPRGRPPLPEGELPADPGQPAHTAQQRDPKGPEIHGADM